jgi:hypothetical protein
MKITKRQLRRIIKEEKAKLIREIREPKWKKGYAGGAPARSGPITKTDTPGSDRWAAAINDLIYSEWVAAGVDPLDPDDAAEVESVLQALRNVITVLEQPK